MINKELAGRINSAGVEKRSQAYRKENEGDYFGADRLRAEAKIDAVEDMVKIWKEFYPGKMSYEDEAYFCYRMKDYLREMGERRRLEWRPEYEEMVSCFLPRLQRQELKDKGLNQQQIAEIAKDQIVKAAWLDKKELEEMREKMNHWHEETGTLNEFKKEFERKTPVLEYFNVMGSKDDMHYYLIKAAQKDFAAAYIAGKDGNETTQIVEKPAETKKEPASLKSVFATVKGFVKYMTMPADEKARIADEKTRIDRLKKNLEKGGWYGKQSLKMLNESEYRICFDSLESVASSIDPESKTITLNSAASVKTQMLSLVNAACVLKQEKDGAGKAPEIMAVRKAEALMMQMNVAKHTDADTLSAFIDNKGSDMNSTFYNATESEYWKHVGGDRTPQAAVMPRIYSACIDAYLDKTLPADKKPSPEQIAKVCRDFDGKSYYTPDNWYSKEGKAKSAGKSDQTESKETKNVYMETINAAALKKMKQGGR